MFFLIALIAAVLAWFVGRGLFARTGLPTRDILYAEVGSTFPQPAPLISKRYRLSGRPDYLVRVKDGIAPVELKSSQSPSSGRPYNGHLFQLAAYCLLVEDVCRVSVPYGLVRYEDRTVRVEYTPSLRASLLALLDEIQTAKRGGECHINHSQPSKCQSCRFPFCLRRGSDLSTLLAKQRLGFRLHAVCARFAGMVRQTVTTNPELFLPVFLLFVWQITAVAVKPRTLGLALLITLLLLVYGYRVLGKTPWLRRLGWVSPRQGFWLYSVLAGLASGAGVWSIARFFHESLGSVPPPHRVLLASASGPMLEEMLFRGLLFWLIFELLRRGRVPKLAAVSATILVIAVGFAFSHAGRTGLSLYTTILTGIAFGWMRAQSESTAAAALMHAVYNLVLSYIATF